MTADQFWTRYAELNTRLEALKNDLEKRGEDTQQLITALNVLKIANVQAQSGAFDEAFDGLSMAQTIYYHVFEQCVLPDMVTAETRNKGGKDRGQQQTDKKQRQVEDCQAIAARLWDEVPKSQRPYSALRTKKNLAPKIREQYRRDGLGEPPAAKWIRENINHPEKNPSS